MSRKFLTGLILLSIAATFLLLSCDKERIVESSERIHDTEYIQLPPDTIVVKDTVFVGDSVVIHSVDTVRIHSTDTVYQTNTVHDTVFQTTTIHDTVVTVQHHYDTVTTVQCNPNEFMAVAALQYYTDPMVIDFINQEFGYDDGWVLYLSTFQLDATQQSTSVYDLYGYIDYWTPDWSAYYPLEFYWRVSFTGGDPANPNNWQLSDPPAVSAGHTPGVKLVPPSSAVRSLQK